MKQPTLPRRAVSTAQVLGNDLRVSLKRRTSSSRWRSTERTLSAGQTRVLDDLRRNGFAILEEYWSRAESLAMRDRLLPYFDDGQDRDFDNGAKLRFNRAAAYDAGVRRLYRVDHLEPKLETFRFDPGIEAVVHAYYGYEFRSELLLYQSNISSSSGTRGHHVDSWWPEFKTFLYLDDVTIENGPFAYLPGSHRRHGVRLKKQLLGNNGGPWTSFYDEDVSQLGVDETPLVGPAGTVILADVRGFHRGLPQHEGTRSVLVNYLTPAGAASGLGV